MPFHNIYIYRLMPVKPLEINIDSVPDQTLDLSAICPVTLRGSIWLWEQPMDVLAQRKRGQRMTYSVPYSIKHRACIVLLQPLVRVKARVNSRQWSPLSETYAVRALAVCVGVWRMRAFETQTPIQVDSSCLAAVTCLALYAWFPSNLWLYPIDASSSCEETWSTHWALHQRRSPRGQTAEEVPHDKGKIRSHYRMDIMTEENMLEGRTHQEASYTAE